MKINPQINMFGWYWNVLAVSSKIACVYVVCTFTLWMTLCLYMSMFVNIDAYKRKKNILPQHCIRRKFHFCELGMAILGIAKPWLCYSGHCKSEPLYQHFIFYGFFFFPVKNCHNSLQRIKIYIETACWVPSYLKSFNVHLN